MIFFDCTSTDPYYNLACEEYVFESLDRTQSYFMLWQNHNTVVVGKHQNTVEEINQEYVRTHDIRVVRRLSGGGAVYHDLGNLNFTFIVDKNVIGDFDFKVFTTPVIKALAKLGITAEFNSRNDLTIEGKKFSGNSQYHKGNRMLHHGTLLFNSDLDVIEQVLTVKQDKIESKGIKSIRSRVTNISEHMQGAASVAEFKALLVKNMFEAGELEEHTFTPQDIARITRLRDEKYATWEWNYGASPKYNARKSKRFECGEVTALMQVEKGLITCIKFYGDYFGGGESAEVEKLLVGWKVNEEDITAALEGVELGKYFRNMTFPE
ncbi:MAG TPA: lipoate--protein ligase, partial [Longilinea sp.]|nr:lipoate--protein ligase [Longilinea sp.]